MIGILVEVEVAAYPYSPSCDKWFFLMQKDTMKILLYSKVAAIQQHPEWAQCSHTLMRVESLSIISSEILPSILACYLPPELPLRHLLAESVQTWHHGAHMAFLHQAGSVYSLLTSHIHR